MVKTLLEILAEVQDTPNFKSDFTKIIDRIAKRLKTYESIIVEGTKTSHLDYYGISNYAYFGMEFQKMKEYYKTLFNEEYVESEIVVDEIEN